MSSPSRHITQHITALRKLRPPDEREGQPRPRRHLRLVPAPRGAADADPRKP